MFIRVHPWPIFLLSAAVLTAADLSPLSSFPLRSSPLAITAPAQPAKPFTVVGESGAALGRQDGSFEAWLWPVKILSHFGVTAELEDYPVPIGLVSQAAAIEVTPAMTTLTYSHAAFTIKQRMFAPRGGGADQGIIVLFEIASIRPLSLTFRFQPEMLRMWPAPNYGPASAEWVKEGDSGFYVLHTNDAALTAAVAMPRATPGILPPYQERPRTYPVELKLRFEPKQDSALVFPLLIAMAAPSESGCGLWERAPTTVRESLQKRTHNPHPTTHNRTSAGLARINSRIATLYSQTADFWERFVAAHLRLETPDKSLDRALQWAEIAIEQGRIRHGAESGLAAGFYESGDSARPGFGWFFGRDALWTSYATNSDGDFALTRDAVEFLVRRQRADGKIMHEFSQTAELVDWKATSYFYAAADSTPLFVMAMEDYINTSGDTAFLSRHWDAVKRAYAFTRTHDSDGDGIYENTEGTGWVESWPPGMPHQEIYLAALDEQSADAMSRLALLMKDHPLAASARDQAGRIRAAIEKEYHQPSTGFYAFSRGGTGGSAGPPDSQDCLDSTATIFPAVAWWTGRYALAQPGGMFDRWASAEFSTDWGTRDISPRTPFYDPISYHQGTVWPLFTGWVSLAEFRAGRPLSGYAHLMQNAGLTWAQDLGAVTELLSGEFFEPLGRSSSHQVWSSAMVVTPALRGLFGLDWDALDRTLRLAPNLPAAWDSARLWNVPLGDSRLEIDYRRDRGRLVVAARSTKPEVVCLVAQSAPRDQPCAAPPALVRELALDLPPVELGISHTLPLPGSQTAQLKVIGERFLADRATFTLEAPAGATCELPLRLNRPGARLSGGEIAGSAVRVRFPPGTGYQRVVVSFEW